MNNIENYGSVNVNTNYRKVNKNPNFKAFVISETGVKSLEFAKEVLAKEPTNFVEIGIFDWAVKFLNNIKAIKPFAESTKFFDLVVNDNNFGLRKPFFEESIVNDFDFLHSEGKKIFKEDFGEKQLVAELKDEATAKKFEGKMDFETFCDLFKELEENAQTKANDAMETLKELLGNNIKIVQQK